MCCDDKDTTIGPRTVFQGEFDAIKIFAKYQLLIPFFHRFADEDGGFREFRKSDWRIPNFQNSVKSFKITFIKFRPPTY